jgi:hypothetical protein
MAWSFSFHFTAGAANEFLRRQMGAGTAPCRFCFLSVYFWFLALGFLWVLCG